MEIKKFMDLSESFGPAKCSRTTLSRFSGGECRTFLRFVGVCSCCACCDRSFSNVNVVGEFVFSDSDCEFVEPQTLLSVQKTGSACDFGVRDRNEY